MRRKSCLWWGFSAVCERVDERERVCVRESVPVSDEEATVSERDLYERERVEMSFFLFSLAF